MNVTIIGPDGTPRVIPINQIGPTLDSMGASVQPGPQGTPLGPVPYVQQEELPPPPPAVPEAPQLPAQPQNPVQQAPEAPQPAPQPVATPIAQAFNAQDPYAEFRRVMGVFEGDGVNPRSGAAGFGQVLPSTYADWVTRYRPMFPWMPATFEEWKKAPRELQERVYNEIIYPREYRPALEGAGLEFSPINAAVTNFLGPTGGPAFIRQAVANPQAPATSFASPEAVAANRAVFFDKNGRERTAGEVMAFIGRGQGGVLTGVNSDASQPAEGGGPGIPQDVSLASAQANPYRDRLFQLLQSIESERGQRPDMGELMLRMGSGILSGKTLTEGLGKGAAAAADYLAQQRQLAANRDRNLMYGYQALANDKAMRDTYNAPRNLRVIPKDGSPAFDVIGRIINGQTYVRDPKTGQEVPVHQAYPDADVRFSGINDSLMFEQRAGGIPGAVRVMTIGDEQVPVFEFQREGQEKAFGFGLNAITAHQGMMKLEGSGYDPTRVQAAIAQAIADKRPMSIQQFLRQFTSPEDQQYATYALQYINAIARRESGAQINEGEWARYAAMFVPRVGADASSIREHAQIRMNNIVPLIGQAGPAAFYLGDTLSGTRKLPSAYSDPRAVEASIIRTPTQPQTQPGSQQGGPRRLERLNPGTINALRDDEEVQVNNGGQWITVTGRQLKEELAKRQQRRN